MVRVRTTRKKSTTAKKPKTTRKSTTAKTTSSSGSSGGLSGAAVLNALNNDPAAMSQLSDSVASNLFSGGFAAEIVQAIEAVIQGGRSLAPGRRMAGTVSILAGAIQGGGYTGAVMRAMVFLHGDATAVSCYVPPHLEAEIVIANAAGVGAAVWVEPVNGAHNDLMVVAVRGYTLAPPGGRVVFLATPHLVNGAALTASTVYTLSVAGAFGVPPQASGLYLLGSLTSTTAGATFNIGNSGTQGAQYVHATAPVASTPQWFQGICPIGADGKINYQASAAATLDIWAGAYLI